MTNDRAPLTPKLRVDELGLGNYANFDYGWYALYWCLPNQNPSGAGS
ncbi:MAG: hypothetical protein ACRC32_19045 [Chroococcidiopsis sp.]